MIQYAAIYLPQLPSLGTPGALLTRADDIVALPS
jgi:hypothetical protein